MKYIFFYIHNFFVFQKTKCNPYNRSYDKSSSSYELDTAYRVLGDHTRMITACLADKMFPDQK